VTLKHLIFLFLFYLGGGVFLSFGALKQKQIGPNYFRIHGLGLSLILFIAYWLVGHSFLDNATTLWFSIFLTCAFGFSLFTGVSTRLSVLSFFLGAICFFGCMTIHLSEIGIGRETSFLLLNSCLSTLLLGFTMAAMMLGHWYLVQPKLSIDELRRTTLIMIVLLIGRFIFATYQSTMLFSAMNEVALLKYLVGVPGVFVLMRYVWGILGSLILSFLVWKTVQIRSTQSATGILYVVVVSTLVGEILSLYLAFYFGITL